MATIAEAMARALKYHQAGQLSQAEQIYRQVLQVEPCQQDALHLLGVLAGQVGNHALAVEYISSALRLDATQAAFHANLGRAYRALGKFAEAAACCRSAVHLKPDWAEAHNGLGNVLQDQGQLAEAIACYQEAVRLQADYAAAHYNLGTALQGQGRADEALACYEHALQLQPDFAEARNNLGAALAAQGKLDKAVATYRQCLSLRPHDAEAHNNLGFALGKQGLVDEAIACYRHAARLRPDYAGAHSNLGMALAERGLLDEAIACCRQALRLRPDYPEAHNNLAPPLADQGRLDEALASCRQALHLRADYPEAHNNLGNLLKDMGLPDQAVAAYRRALELCPSSAVFHNNLVYALHFDPGITVSELKKEHERWQERHARPLAGSIRRPDNDPVPGRRLRVGYVSADFRGHVIGRNLLPLLREHDHEQYEIFCYAHVAVPDALTEQFVSHADAWRNILEEDDERSAELIRSDRIDILVDLSLHLRGSRLLIFARKPAPVQVAFAAYPGGTGLEAMDWRLTDPYLDPPCADSHYVERSYRLPDSFWCYDREAMTWDPDPAAAPLPEVGPLPAAVNGHITFGCLNNFCKVNDRVLELWGQVLQALPRSRLLILAPEGAARRRVREKLEGSGVARQRLEFVAFQARRRYLAEFNRIDVSLETWPYNGHTTTLDSLWMGVPVVTLAGETAVSRAGLSILANVELPELVARTPGQYVELVTRLAGDLPRLASLRQNLRDRLQRSPLMDAPRFARNVEAAFRAMWRSWIEAGAGISR